jgi:uncharacterized membrane protein YqjE
LWFVYLNSDRIFGLALILLGLVVFCLSILVAIVAPSKCWSPYPTLGFVALVVLALAGVRYIVFSIPRYKDLK